MRKLTTLTLAVLLLLHRAAGAQDAPSPLGDTTAAIGPVKNGTTQVAWSYVSLEAGVDMFERRSPQVAPGAVMRYKMPKGMLPPKDKDGKPEDTTAAIAVKGWSVPLPLAPDLSFVLPPNPKAKADGAYIVVSRRFPSGMYQHPDVDVRTPDLPRNVLRLGDLRLACEIQVRILKKDMLRARLLLDAMSLFGKSPCESDTGKIFDAPAVHNSIIFTAGKRRQVKTVAGTELEFNAPLGDSGWPDDTLIAFELDGEPAPQPVASPRPLQTPQPFAVPMDFTFPPLPPAALEPDLPPEAPPAPDMPESHLTPATTHSATSSARGRSSA
ncbi:MAG: hypothetical protein ABW069_06755 [Duganella sp.]